MTLNLQLTDKEMDFVWAVLLTRPANETYPLLKKIEAQIAAQRQPQIPQPEVSEVPHG